MFNFFVVAVAPNEMPSVAQLTETEDPIVATSMVQTHPMMVGLKKSGDVVLLPQKTRIKNEITQRLTTKTKQTKPEDRAVKKWLQINQEFNEFSKRNQNWVNFTRMLNRSSNKANSAENELGVLENKWDEFTFDGSKGNPVKNTISNQYVAQRIREKRLRKMRGPANLTTENLKKLLVTQQARDTMKWYDNVPGWGPPSRDIWQMRKILLNKINRQEKAKKARQAKLKPT